MQNAGRKPRPRCARKMAMCECMRGYGIKLSRVLTLLPLLFIALLCQAQETTITVRLLNGKNGKPIPDRNFNIWIGDAGNVLHDTDSQREIKLDVTNAKPRTIRVLPDFRFDCRSNRDFGRGDRIEYPLDEILSKGVISKNLCGKATSQRQPGVLVIFVRPRTLMEKFKL
jgi:hypothetical protein